MSEMPKTGYMTCVEIMQNLKTHGMDSEVPTTVLVQTIKRVAGLDKRVVKKYLSALADFGFITPMNSKVWKINTINGV